MMNQEVKLTKIVGGGQALGTLESGKKAFVWGGLPDETVSFRVTKKKSSMIEGIVTEIITKSPDRIEPTDPDSYLSTSPWQIMSFEAETAYKQQLIDDAFRLHSVELPSVTEVHSDGEQFSYRNKVEFSWWGDIDNSGKETLDLAFFMRGGKGKIPVQGTSLAKNEINTLARSIRDILHASGFVARDLKTLLIRCDQSGNCVWQLYVKDEEVAEQISTVDFSSMPASGGEIIFSDPRSPASRITKRISSYGDHVLTDTILSVPFSYATEGFFQVNVPLYEQTLRDMQQWIPKDTPVIDMYSGVGTIGLTIGGDKATLIEIDEHAVREMKRNIDELKSTAIAVLAASEAAVDYITQDATIILDPPRAGLHNDVVIRLLEQKPWRIVYLSCNPVTQARDTEKLLASYKIVHHKGYNFFPRTPHIEHLVVLDLI
jgi:23S rRNA (uracil1939-C5)-methyltransferase